MARPRVPDHLASPATLRRRKAERRAGVIPFKLTPGPVDPPPDGLNADGLEEWIRVTTELRHTLAPAHRGAVLEYCFLSQKLYAWARGEGGMSAGERRVLNSLRTQLGLWPTSKRPAPPSPPAPVDPWTKFSGRQGA